MWRRRQRGTIVIAQVQDRGEGRLCQDINKDDGFVRFYQLLQQEGSIPSGVAAKSPVPLQYMVMADNKVEGLMTRTNRAEDKGRADKALLNKQPSPMPKAHGTHRQIHAGQDAGGNGRKGSSWWLFGGTLPANKEVWCTPCDAGNAWAYPSLFDGWCRLNEPQDAHQGDKTPTHQSFPSCMLLLPEETTPRREVLITSRRGVVVSPNSPTSLSPAVGSDSIWTTCSTPANFLKLKQSARKPAYRRVQMEALVESSISGAKDLSHSSVQCKGTHGHGHPECTGS